MSLSSPPGAFARSAHVAVEPHDPVLVLTARGGKALQDLGVVPGDHEPRRVGQAVDAREASIHIGHVVDRGKRPLLLDVGVEVRSVGRQHQPALVGMDTHDLEAGGMAPT